MSSPYLGYPIFFRPDAPFGLLYTFEANSSTPKSTYSDKDNLVPNINPVQLDATGSAIVRLGAGSYKFVLLDQSNTVTLFTADYYDSSVIAYPQTAAEATVGVTPTNTLYPPGNVLRYGLVPNTAGSAAANAVALKALISYNIHHTGWKGTVTFPNTTGTDIYYFNDYLDFRPGIEVDLQNCTLTFQKGTDATDVNSGFVSAIRDFSIRNGYINVNFQCVNGGHGMMFGARGADGTYFTPLYDSTLTDEIGNPTTMGNIKVTNVKVTSNNPSQRCVLMLGGLQDVSFENLWMDGTSVADGLYYEFGWATDNGGVLAGRQTSHAHNISFKNIKVTNLYPAVAGVGGGSAIAMNGAYNVSIDGLKVINAGVVCGFGFGESYFYNPWSAVDTGIATKRGITMRNIVGKGISSAAFSLQGANTSSVAGGYLAAVLNALATPALYIAQTDLLSFIIDGFSINCVTATPNHGIAVTGAQNIEISNGIIAGFQRGISLTSECTNYHIRNVNVFGSTVAGIGAGTGNAVWSPARSSLGVIENCFVAGSSTSAASTQPGITIGNSYSCHIRNCRLGYETGHDGVAETTQAQAISLGATAFGVVCDNNYIAGTSGGAVGYALAGSVNSRGCVILNPRGVITQSGLWSSLQTVGNFTIAYSASMTPDASSARNIITATNNTAFTINAPVNGPSSLGGKLTLIIRNTSGGALGVVTWNVIYKMSTWTSPATANSRSIAFDWDGTNWVQSSQTGVDIPN